MVEALHLAHAGPELDHSDVEMEEVRHHLGYQPHLYMLLFELQIVAGLVRIPE